MLTVTFYIEPDFACYEQRFKKLVRAVCRRFNLADARVSIAIVDNNRIRRINVRFLNRKTATDCIAFDLSDLAAGRKFFELVVNGQRAKSEAGKRRHPAQAEAALYITHGLLHLLGFDDLSAAQAKKMHRLEDEILQQQGFGRVYDKNSSVVLKKRRRIC